MMKKLAPMMSHIEHGLRAGERRRIGRFERAGLSHRAERTFNVTTGALVLLFATGWVYAIRDAVLNGNGPPVLSGALTANPLSPDAPPPAAYLLDLAARTFASDASLRGISGSVRVIVQQPGESLPKPDSMPAGAALELAPVKPGEVGAPSGVWNVLLRMRDAVTPVADLSVITLVPLSEKRSGKIGTYLIGSWPYESGERPRSAAYAPPAGLVRVTQENMNTQVSEHFKLSDFLTKGQQNVWPKYVALSPRLLDKLELTIQELEATGYDVKDVGVISGFRTPNYNASGGETGGRGALSRHMYGDAMDIYIDSNGDGRMDDLNHDGRVDFGDAKVLAAAADRVEKKHPSLIGGIGTYRATGAHAGFVHIDTRGNRARW